MNAPGFDRAGRLFQEAPPSNRSVIERFSAVRGTRNRRQSSSQSGFVGTPDVTRFLPEERGPCQGGILRGSIGLGTRVTAGGGAAVVCRCG
jgi:hypothetical protein